MLGKKLEHMNLPDEDMLEIFAETLDYLDEKVLLVDKDGNFRYFNKKFTVRIFMKFLPEILKS